MRLVLTNYLFILALLWHAVGFAQTYYLFPTDTAVWSVIQIDFGIFPNPDTYYSRHYSLLGDTAINGKTYGKIYTNQCPDSMFNMATASCCTFIREDSLKKIYQYINDSTELLLYDFSMNINDTIESPFTKLDYNLKSIDSIMIDGNYRKRYNLESFLNVPTTWIEGIGSTDGLLDWGQYFSTSVITLRCYSENGQIKYGSSPCSWCTVVGINEFDTKEKLEIYPNPTYGRIRIRIRLADKFDYKIYNTHGALLMSGRSVKQQLNIDLEELPAGMYFLQILSGESSYTQKFIKA